MDVPIWFFSILLGIVIFVPIITTNIAESMSIEPQSIIEMNSDLENFLNFVEDLPLIGGLFTLFRFVLFDRIVIFAQYFPATISYFVFLFFGIINLLNIIGIVVLIRRVFGLS